MAKYAVVFTSDIGYLPMANSIINGLQIYGNDVDTHALLLHDVPEYYKEQLPANCFAPKWSSIPPDHEEIKKKGRPWAVRFFRYIYAAKICSDYKSVLIIDSDAFVVNNIMEQFKLSEESGELVMIRNLLGVNPEKVKLEHVKNAVCPSYHCHGTFFNCQNFEKLLRDTYAWSLKEGYSDMATLFRTIIRSGYDIGKIKPLKNELWCWTKFHVGDAVKSFGEDGKIILRYRAPKSPAESMGERISVVHGKWASPKWIYHYAPRLRHGMPPTPSATEKNIVVFKECIEWLNKTGPSKWVHPKDKKN